MLNEETFAIIGYAKKQGGFGFLGKPYTSYDSVIKKSYQDPFILCDYDDRDIRTFSCEFDAREAAINAMRKKWLEAATVVKLCETITSAKISMVSPVFSPLARK